MQPGTGHWTDRAACLNDPRFTQEDKPHAKVLERLEAICANCPVFKDCVLTQTQPFTIGGETYDVIGTFVAGEWREEE